MAVRHASHHEHRPMRIAPNALRRANLGVAVFAGLNAVGGGVGLIVNGLGIPASQLEGTPFDSLLIPGLLLALVVGGSMLVAAAAVWRNDPRAARATMLAGAIMLGWIAVESLMIGDGRGLQATVALMALLTIALGLLQTRADRPDARRGAPSPESV